MMKILITSPTKNEIKPLLEKLRVPIEEDRSFYEADSVSILITGIGIAATLYEITKHIYFEKPEFIINAGIAGTADKNIGIGNVVEIIEEDFADFGVIKGRFMSAEQYGFINEARLVNPGNHHFGLKKVVGRTVHTIDYDKCNLVSDSYFQVESMEGAAFFYVCLKEKIKFAQIRSISNIVGDGNKENWNIDLSIKNLNKELIRILGL